jgi:hypothetical protein
MGCCRQENRRCDEILYGIFGNATYYRYYRYTDNLSFSLE